jgi:hypothetical protein
MKDNETKDQEKEQDQEKDTELTPEELQELWEKSYEKIVVTERQKKMKLLGAIGAVVIIAGMLGVVGYDRMISSDLYLAQDGNLEITLQDGSGVTLLKGSSLSVEKSFPARTRDVYLKGNAIFRVTKSKEHPFIVHGTGYQAKVLGTVFKITQAQKSFKVDLYEGKVAVSKSGDQDDVYMLRPQQTFNNYGNVKVATVSPIVKESEHVTNSPTTIKKPSVHLRFNGCQLKEALMVVENTYGVQISYPDGYGEKSIAIDFNDMPVEAVLQNIALSLGLQLKEYDKKYQLEN